MATEMVQEPAPLSESLPMSLTDRNKPDFSQASLG